MEANLVVWRPRDLGEPLSLDGLLVRHRLLSFLVFAALYSTSSLGGCCLPPLSHYSLLPSFLASRPNDCRTTDWRRRRRAILRQIQQLSALHVQVSAVAAA